MTYEEAFIQAIRENPGDDAPRLIYADWLEEHGQADRGEFIRIHCRLHHLQKTDAGASTLRQRAEELLRRHWEEWVGPLRDIVGPWRDRYGASWMDEPDRRDALHHFMGGFVWVLGLDAENYVRHASHLNRLMPLSGLMLWRAGRCAEALADVAELKGLYSLRFMDYYDAPLTARDAAALAASPYLDGLSVLELGRNSLGDEGVEALARAPWLVSVINLNLGDTGLSDRAALALANSPYLINLRWLNLRRNYLSPDGVAALRTSPNLHRLSSLELDPQQGDVRP